MRLWFIRRRLHIDNIKKMKIIEPGYISHNIACVLCEDSDQPAQPRSLIRVFAGILWVAVDPKYL